MNRTGSRFTKILVIVLSAAAILSAALHFNLLASNVAATWSYDYTHFPPCSAAAVDDCIDHFEILDITRQEHPRVIMSLNNPPSPARKADGITANFKYGPPFGEITFSVIAVERQKDGTFVSSNPYAARTTASIRPGSHAALLF
jgi:hypothetical protein